MALETYFPAWDKLTEAEKAAIKDGAVLRTVSAGTLIHGGKHECTGLLLVKEGQLRAHILSDEGREITLYRLFDGDLCMMAASCMLRSMQADIRVSAEKDTELWIIPPDVVKPIMEGSAAVANLMGEIMATRFSEVMWCVEQILWKSMDRRVAAFLIDESAIEGSDTLAITHETIASHLGTHREVVTRILRYLQSENLVLLRRGAVAIADRKRLMALAQ